MRKKPKRLAPGLVESSNIGKKNVKKKGKDERERGQSTAIKKAQR